MLITQKIAKKEELRSTQEKQAPANLQLVEKLLSSSMLGSI
jgi:hypothetical protein